MNSLSFSGKINSRLLLKFLVIKPLATRLLEMVSDDRSISGIALLITAFVLQCRSASSTTSLSGIDGVILFASLFGGYEKFRFRDSRVTGKS